MRALPFWANPRLGLTVVLVVMHGVLIPAAAGVRARVAVLRSAS